MPGFGETSAWRTSSTGSRSIGCLGGSLPGRTWLDAFTKVLRPYVSGGAYVNCADPDLAGYAQACYGGNLTRLRAIKAKADPQRLFTFPQAV